MGKDHGRSAIVVHDPRYSAREYGHPFHDATVSVGEY